MFVSYDSFQLPAEKLMIAWSDNLRGYIKRVRFFSLGVSALSGTDVRVRQFLDRDSAPHNHRGILHV